MRMHTANNSGSYNVDIVHLVVILTWWFGEFLSI